MDKTKYIIVAILVIGVGFLGFKVTKGNLIKTVETGNNTPTAIPTPLPTPNYQKIVGNFLVTNNEICLENEKPVVYFYGSSTCPHCVWEKPIVQKVFPKFKDVISYHENFDNQNDGDVFLKYKDINPGYIPFLVLGCKYARVGAGETLGATDAESKKLEEEALNVVLCKLTNGKPNSICDPLKDKISQIP